MRRPVLVGLTVVALLVVLAVPAAAESGLFLDDDDSPFEGAIEAIAVADITVGCNPPHDTRFCPARRLTRQAAAAFLARALDLPEATRDHFTDDDGSPFEGEINAIAEAEITTGCNTGEAHFCPTATVSRQAMAAFLARGLELAEATRDHFTDDDGGLLEDEINAIAEAEITTGCNTGEAHFCPTRAVRRGAMAAFLARGLDLQPPGPVPRYQPPEEDFRFFAREVVGHPTVEDRVRGSSWRSGCPVGLQDLRYVRASYVGFDGDVRLGELVVHRRVVDDVGSALRRTFEAGFPIRQMRLVDDFGADDGRSMGANNTSAFNCRYVAGTTRWSNHSYGTAIDINPRQNPWVSNGSYEPPEGEAYADRSDHRAGMLVAGTTEVAAWTDLGWDWGGTWSSVKDYQHFSEQGG